MLLAILAFALSSCTRSTLSVRSDPAGARLWVGGQDWGTTPASRDALRPGVYRFEMRAEGHLDWTGDIALARGDQEVFARLARQELPAPIVLEAPPPPPTRLSVFVDPGGKVEVDEREIGRGAPGEASILDIPGSPPTSLRLRVTQANYAKWEKEIPIESNRDNRVYVQLVPVEPWYRYPTDAALLRRLLGAVATHAREIPSLSAAARIAVVPIESSDVAATPIDRSLEDAFVSALASAGFLPIERSDAMLVTVAHQAVGPELPYRVVTAHDGRDRNFPWEAELASTGRESETIPAPCPPTASVSDPCRGLIVLSPVAQGTIVHERTTRPLVSRIPTADQLLAYRVLEAGVSHTSIIDYNDTRPEPSFHRRAELRLHLRLENARTGDILWAGDVGGILEDEIPVRIARELSNPPAVFVEPPGPPPRAINLPASTTPVPIAR